MAEVKIGNPFESSDDNCLSLPWSHFSKAPTDYTTERCFEEEVSPIVPISTDSRNFAFQIDPSPYFLNLKSTRLEIGLRLAKKDGTALPEPSVSKKIQKDQGSLSNSRPQSKKGRKRKKDILEETKEPENEPCSKKQKAEGSTSNCGLLPKRKGVKRSRIEDDDDDDDDDNDDDGDDDNDDDDDNGNEPFAKKRKNTGGMGRGNVGAAFAGIVWDQQPANTIIKDLDVTISGVSCSPTFQTYAYTSYFSTLLGYTRDTMISKLEDRGWYMEESVDSCDIFSGGLKQRSEWSNGSKTYHLSTPLHSPLFQQPRYMVSSVCVAFVCVCVACELACVQQCDSA